MLSSLVIACFVHFCAHGGDELRFEPYETQGSDRQPLRGELGFLRVPLRASAPEGPQLELAFARFRSASEKPRTPIFYLAGGPGASGIERCVGPATGRFVRLLEHADVIGLDQRGTGRSEPRFDERDAEPLALPLDRKVSHAEYAAAYGVAAQRCAERLRARGVELAALHTEASADDLEALRAALGLERIVLWGESYGTHLALAYLRRYPSRVERAVLFRVEGPDHTWKLPSATQRYLEQLAGLVAADPQWREQLPDLVGTVKELLARFAHERCATRGVAEDSSGELEIALGPYDLQSYLADALGLAFALRELPAALQRLRSGDYAPLFATALANRRSGVESPMALAMDCASGGSAERLQQLAAESADPRYLLGAAANGPYPLACSTSGALDLGAAYRASFDCAVPVLFCSGSLDAKTPPANSDELLPRFSRGVHVIAENAGHEPIEVMDPAFRELLRAFLAGETVEGRRIALPTPRFRPPSGG